ncbi:MAG: zinc dependent phospholipase C family protein [Bacteroidota bacterium]|nr:zinc dependent phospholipase C family protein [Bacteroidota bacterium]
MIKKFTNRIIAILFFVSISFTLISWGTFGHEHINRAAVLALPQPLQAFFYNHIDYITQESTVPDLRKYTLSDKAENPRHYIDLENFGSRDSLPRTLDEVKLKYDTKFIADNGILPWYIQEMMAKLTTAFKEKRKTEILFLAADLGHYLGDAHMPLHTSANHDGQMTNQKGIHSLWESRLPELFGRDYNYYTGDAKYVEDVEKETWNIIFNSHQLVDTLLLIDRQLKLVFPADKIYEKDAKGNVVKSKFKQSIFSLEYATQLHKMLNGMVEKQLAKSVAVTANFWYTAWVNAGKPDLSKLDAAELTQRNKPLLKKDLKNWKKGKLFGIEADKEF